jgi:hypothetical protein
MKFVVLPLMALPLLLSGCFNTLQPGGSSLGKGLVQVTLAAPGEAAPNLSARTAMPLASSLF